MSRSARRRCGSRCRCEMPELLEWDTEFWGKRIGRAGAPDEAQGDFDCLYYLADVSDVVAIRTAEFAGFKMADVRVTLEMRSPGFQIAATVREAEPEDRAELRKIARLAHSTTRFYAD